MSYVIPSVLVYQQLANAGGVLNSTPDLEACIIGPLNNVINYIPDSIAAAIKTAAVSAVSTSCTTTSGSYTITDVAAPGTFSVGHTVIVKGAGKGGANLQGVITVIAGNVFTLDTAASVSLTEALISRPGTISGVASSTSVGVASGYAGQIVDPASVKVWLNSAKVKTASTKAFGYSANTTLTFSSGGVALAVGGVTSGATSIVLATTGPNTVNIFAVGDSITIPGAGATAGLYSGTITAINYATNTLTVTPATATTVAAGVLVSKVATANINSLTNTLRLEPGDKIRINYTNTSSVAKSFTTTAGSVLTTSKLNGNLTSVTVNDVLPADLSSTTTTTGSNLSGATTLNIASSTGLNIGDWVRIAGGGAGSTDLVTKIITVPNGTSITTADALGTTVEVGGVVTRAPYFTVDVIKTYNNQLLPTVRPNAGGNQIDLTDVGLHGTVVISSYPELVYGQLQEYVETASDTHVPAASVYIQYRALRTDQAQTVLTVNDAIDAEGQFGDLTDANPLGLGVSIALANTTGRVRAISVSTNDMAGYLEALNLSQGERVYYMTPLTQDPAILAAFQAHVDQMSVPAMASWRIALINTAIPTTKNIGSATSAAPNTNSGANTITNISTFYTLTSSNSTFITDGVTPGDSVNLWNTTSQSFVAFTVSTVASNTTLVLSGFSAADLLTYGTATSFYISRLLTKTQQAQAVAATSAQFNDKRIIHVQPDYVGVTVNGVVKKLPGYYLCCGLAGMGAGFPVQQGFTNIGVAGISTLYNSNYYFARADLNTMAAAGTFIFVQSTQAGIPYCRHEMTTDVSVLEYRELLVVKNWDFLSYYYHDKLAPFIGSWNITPDTINIIRQTIIASSELLITKKLPKIGPPLLSYNLTSIAQDTSNKDNLNVKLTVSVVYPLNYLNLYLII